MSWSWIVIMVSIVFLTLLVWKECMRANRSRLALRIISSALAVAALVVLAVPVSIRVDVPEGSGNSMVLLSDGFSRDSLSKYRHIPLFTTDGELLKNNPALNILYIPDLSNYLKTASVLKIHLLGYGLPASELDALREKPVAFHPANIPPGIISLSKTDDLKPGRTLVIRGKINNPGSGPLKLLLRGLNTTLDSTILPAGNLLNFSLSAVPRHLGKAIYTIQVFSGKVLLEEEKVPVNVMDAAPVKILMLAASPGFESKFLKNWLYERHYALALRTAISKEKFSKEYLNLPKTNLDLLTPSLLQNFDLVLVDAAQLNTIGTAEARALEVQVNNGMGLLIRNDSIRNPSSSFLKMFRTYKAETDSQKSIGLSLPEGGPTRLKTEDASFIQAGPGDQPLLSDVDGRILVNSRLYGRGKVVLSTLPETYSLALSGKYDSYGTIWAGVLEKVAKKFPAERRWSSAKQFPVAGEPVQLTMEQFTGEYPSVSRLKPEQNSLYPGEWNMTYFPSKPGWNLAEQDEEGSFELYIQPKSSWKALKAAEKVSATNSSLQNSSKIDAQKPGKSEKGRLPIPGIYIMLVFIGACTYLWLETKLL